MLDALAKRIAPPALVSSCSLQVLASSRFAPCLLLSPSLHDQEQSMTRRANKRGRMQVTPQMSCSSSGVVASADAVDDDDDGDVDDIAADVVIRIATFTVVDLREAPCTEAEDVAVAVVGKSIDGRSSTGSRKKRVLLQYFGTNQSTAFDLCFLFEGTPVTRMALLSRNTPGWNRGIPKSEEL